MSFSSRLSPRIFRFFQRSVQFIWIVLLSGLLSCAPEKSEIAPNDLKRVLERVAEMRIQTALASDIGKPSPSDKELFEEACKIYRLQLDKAKEALALKNKDLYETIYGK